ncbi:hypothetical protein SKAU_G00188390 [Synaphobranchus kaupii]|uniref:Uncharacterized protein n=1 Tax=Synaphobranchus kaupii TaxID=118154 RepID=A0A9Q1FDH3_SYNKA|nr:hypothetical protein SKAU_G00188390 [Synaphobranchus kaupii]
MFVIRVAGRIFIVLRKEALSGRWCGKTRGVRVRRRHSVCETLRLRPRSPRSLVRVPSRAYLSFDREPGPRLTLPGCAAPRPSISVSAARLRNPPARAGSSLRRAGAKWSFYRILTGPTCISAGPTAKGGKPGCHISSPPRAVCGRGGANRQIIKKAELN